MGKAVNVQTGPLHGCQRDFLVTIAHKGHRARRSSFDWQNRYRPTTIREKTYTRRNAGCATTVVSIKKCLISRTAAKIANKRLPYNELIITADISISVPIEKKTKCSNKTRHLFSKKRLTYHWIMNVWTPFIHIWPSFHLSWNSSSYLLAATVFICQYYGTSGVAQHDVHWWKI